jgi:hypothetical protein
VVGGTAVGCPRWLWWQELTSTTVLSYRYYSEGAGVRQSVRMDSGWTCANRRMGIEVAVDHRSKLKGPYLTSEAVLKLRSHRW